MDKGTLSVAAITSGRNEPSARYRVRQHIGLLANQGINVKEYIPLWSKYGTLPKWVQRLKQKLERKSEKSIGGTSEPIGTVRQNPLWEFALTWQRLPAVAASYCHEVTWLERNLMPGKSSLEKYLHRPIVLDLDDALWLEGPKAADSLRFNLSIASEVIVGNSYLADWCRSYNSKITVIPTAVDVELFRPLEESSKSDIFTIGWIGSSSNFPYLERVFPALEEILESGIVLQFWVIADKAPILSEKLAMNTRFTLWYPEAEKLVSQFHVGLMPLEDTEWARGKCSLKMLQYMAAGVVPVVSPVGMNNEILSMGTIGFSAQEKEDWIERLVYLYQNPEVRIRLSAQARTVAATHFSSSVISKQIGEVLQRAAQTK